jgi:hypothetical protein
MGLAAACPTDEPGQALTPSGGDDPLVPPLGFLLSFLAGPAPLPLHDLADVFGVEADAEVPLDEGGDTVGGPQLSLPTVGLGPLQEQALQFGKLLPVEEWGPAGVGLGGQGLGPLSVELQPGVNGGAAAAEEVGDVVGRLPLLDEFDGPSAAVFEFLGSTDRSHTFGTMENDSLFNWICWSQ